MFAGTLITFVWQRFLTPIAVYQITHYVAYDSGYTCRYFLCLSVILYRHSAVFWCCHSLLNNHTTLCICQLAVYPFLGLTILHIVRCLYMICVIFKYFTYLKNRRVFLRMLCWGYNEMRYVSIKRAFLTCQFPSIFFRTVTYYEILLPSLLIIVLKLFLCLQFFFLV